MGHDEEAAPPRDGAERIPGAARAARDAREAAALRRNLRGRKEQQRARAAVPAEAPGEKGTEPG